MLEQVGRGYTDVLAALLAGGVGAAELQIWKEVDGIFTAGPRKVPTARVVPVVSPDEAAELTYYGSEVIHPFAMEQVGCVMFFGPCRARLLKKARCAGHQAEDTYPYQERRKPAGRGDGDLPGPGRGRGGGPAARAGPVRAAGAGVAAGPDAADGIGGRASAPAVAGAPAP